MPTKHTVTMDSIRVREIARVDTLPFTDLQLGLLKSGVKILDADDVQAYQAAKLKEALHPETPYPRDADFLRLGLAAAFGCALLVYWASTSGGWLFMTLTVGCAVATALSAAALIYEYFHPSAPALAGGGVTKWRKYEVGGCEAGTAVLQSKFEAAGTGVNTEIPDAGLLICGKLAATGVTAAFFVEQLDADPFLGVVTERERYYLFVWDEEGFRP
jgi:hypothetical protein